MEKLIEGVRRFRQDVHDRNRELFADLARGQNPQVLFITCSDSRIVPQLLTGSEPGELFVVRNAGNMVPPYRAASSGEEASIEFAVTSLGVRDIVICGHSACGAMRGLLDPDSLAGVPSVARWLEVASAAPRIVDEAYGFTLSDAERLRRTTEVHVLRQIENLGGHPAVASALARNAVSLHAWIFDIGAGVVTVYDETSQAFVELTDEARPVRPSLDLTKTYTARATRGSEAAS